MSKKILTIKDISCYGQCSITVALPVLSAYGIETAILPTAVLSTHTSGFKDFTVLDLTSEMPKILNHWISEKIRFEALYTGYISSKEQFDIIEDAKMSVLGVGGVFFVDPAMADHGKLYPALNKDIINGMKRLATDCDYIIPNVTEACFITDTEYSENKSLEELSEIAIKLYNMGSRNVIITGLEIGDSIGALAYDGKQIEYVLKPKCAKSYHGTGDLFSSMFIAQILNNKSTIEALNISCDFIIDCINQTVSDESHSYGVKFEEVLNKSIH